MRRIESLWIINGSADTHDRVQRLLRSLVISPAAKPLTVFPPEAVEAAARVIQQWAGDTVFDEFTAEYRTVAEAALAAALEALPGENE